jgi:hypothetical protein
MKTQRHNESKGFDCEFEERSWSRSAFRKVRWAGRAHLLDVYTSEGWAYQEHTRWDPKDGELCLVRTKSGETLMEVRSDSDVQIDRRNWV